MGIHERRASITTGKPVTRQVEETHTTQFRRTKRNKNGYATAGFKKIKETFPRVKTAFCFFCLFARKRVTMYTRLHVSRCPPHDRDYSSATVLEVAVDRDETPLRSSRHLRANIRKKKLRIIFTNISTEREKHGCFLFELLKLYGNIMILVLNTIVIVKRN